MQDRTYSDLLFLIQSLVGGGNLTTEEQGSIDSFINRRAHEAFQTSQTWPRFLVSSEERDLISIALSGVAGTDNTELNSNYAFLGKTQSASDYGGITINPGTDVWYSKDSATTPTIGSSDITNATVIYQQQRQGSSDGIRWIVRTGATISYQKSDSKTFVVSEIASGNIRLKESTGGTATSPLDVVSWVRLSGITGTPKLLSKQLILYSQNYSLAYGSSSTIGEFLKVYRKQAFLNDSSLEYDFFVDSDGANVLNISNATDNAAFVTYKKQLPQYTITSTDIPGEWFFFIAHGAYADFLRMEGKVEQSMAEEGVAQGYLAQELEKVDNMSNNNVFRRFSTHGTRQSR